MSPLSTKDSFRKDSGVLKPQRTIVGVSFVLPSSAMMAATVVGQQG